VQFQWRFTGLNLVWSTTLRLHQRSMQRPSASGGPAGDVVEAVVTVVVAVVATVVVGLATTVVSTVGASMSQSGRRVMVGRSGRRTSSTARQARSTLPVSTERAEFTLAGRSSSSPIRTRPPSRRTNSSEASPARRPSARIARRSTGSCSTTSTARRTGSTSAEPTAGSPPGSSDASTVIVPTSAEGGSPSASSRATRPPGAISATWPPSGSRSGPPASSRSATVRRGATRIVTASGHVRRTATEPTAGRAATRRRTDDGSTSSHGSPGATPATRSTSAVSSAAETSSEPATSTATTSTAVAGA